MSCRPGLGSDEFVRIRAARRPSGPGASSRGRRERTSRQPTSPPHDTREITLHRPAPLAGWSSHPYARAAPHQAPQPLHVRDLHEVSRPSRPRFALRSSAPPSAGPSATPRALPLSFGRPTTVLPRSSSSEPGRSTPRLFRDPIRARRSTTPRARIPSQDPRSKTNLAALSGRRGRRSGLARRLAATAGPRPARAGEALVRAGDQVALDLLGGVEGDADDDQQ